LRYAALEEAGDAKIDELECPIGLDHDVARLQVTEDHRWLLLMQVFEHIAELHQPAAHLELGDGTAPCLHGRQGLPFDEFHHQKEATILRESIVDDGQVRMAQLAQEASFLQEETPRLLRCLRVHRISRHQFFERQPLIELDVPGLVDATHPTLGQQALNTIAPTDNGPWNQRHLLRHDLSF
jgi:hypothetical protein